LNLVRLSDAPIERNLFMATAQVDAQVEGPAPANGADSDQWTRDLSTAHGETTLRTENVSDYLVSLGVYDPQRRRVTFDASEVAVAVQRAALKTEGNTIKERMLEDVLQGGTLPTKAVSESDEGRDILDGLQRTDVEAQALDYLLKMEQGDMGSIPSFARAIIERLGEKALSVDAFLQRPVFLQLWRNLEDAEQVRLFMVLNIGQQKVSPRHLLEVLNRPLERMFSTWGIPTITEKSEQQHGKPRAKWRNDALKLPPFKLEYLINGVMAYVERDPQVKTKAKLESVYHDQDTLANVGSDICKRLIALGDDASHCDFEWACLLLNQEIARVYSENSKWRVAILQSDNFFLPMMAALGKAREQDRPEQVEERKKDILDLLRSAQPGSDPLQFSAPSGNNLEAVLDAVRSNIGRTRRAIVYKAWRDYFRRGKATHTVYLDWHEASVS
jgi:hypothetical protein